jgi:hypothetical protein
MKLSVCTFREAATSLGLLAAALGLPLAATAPIAASPTAAKTAAVASMPAILTVVVNGTAPKAFSIRDLEDLGTSAFETSTPWTNKVSRFEGVLLKDVLLAAGARTGQIKAVALNDYSASLPVSDAFDHPVLLAYKVDGDRLSIRNKGPFWIVYPFDANPSLKREVIYARSVWQLKRIEIEP